MVSVRVRARAWINAKARFGVRVTLRQGLGLG